MFKIPFSIISVAVKKFKFHAIVYLLTLCFSDLRIGDVQYGGGDGVGEQHGVGRVGLLLAGGGRTWRRLAGEALAADVEAEAVVDDGDSGQDILV